MNNIEACIQDVLARFQLSLLSHPYVLERHSIILHAITHAQHITPIVTYDDYATRNDASIVTFPATLEASRAVEALGLVCQAMDVSGPLSASALTAITTVIDASNDVVVTAARTVSTEKRAFHSLDAPQGMVGTATEYTGSSAVGLETASSRDIGVTSHATAHNVAPIPIVCAELCNDGCYTAALELALYAALHTRFELTDSTQDQKVYLRMLELIETVLLHSHAPKLEAVIQVAAVTHCVRMAIDGNHTTIVQQAAVTALERVITHYVSLVNSISTHEHACGRCLDRVQMVLCCLVHQLATVLGATAPKRVSFLQTGPDFYTLTPENTESIPEFTPTIRKDGATGTHFLTSRHQLLPFCEPVLPFHCTAVLSSPLQLTATAAQHTLNTVGLDKPTSLPAYDINWPARELSHGGLEQLLAHCGRSDAFSLFRNMAYSDSKNDPNDHISDNSAEESSSSVEGTPMSMSSDIEALSHVRLKRVTASAPLFALSALTRLFSHINAFHCGNMFESTAWAALVADRVCLALVWLADGVGPEASILKHSSGVLDSRAKPSSSWFGKTTASTTASTTTGTTQTKPNAAVALQIPLLPQFSMAVNLLLHLLRCRDARQRISAPLELLVQRVLVRAVSAPSRLILGISVLVGVENMRILLGELIRAQAMREAMSQRLASSSGIILASHALPMDSLTQSSIVKSVVQKLQAAFPGSDVDTDTVETLVALFSPNSPLLIYTDLALSALHQAAQDEALIAFLGHAYDCCSLNSDVVRAVAQACASIALGDAHVYSMHGKTTAGGICLRAPFPEVMRMKSASVVRCMLRSFRSINAAHVERVSPQAVQARRELVHGKRVTQAAAKAFNAKPKRGADILRVCCSADSASSASLHHSIAEAIHRLPFSAGFHPVALGEYLGTGDTAEDDAKRRAHASLHADVFTGESIVSALRSYLTSFRLPGEAQMIDRILQAFATVAHASCKEGTFLPSIDATYILSFSIIMLNTDLHNPNIRPEKKMSEDAFVKNNVYYGDEVCHGRRIPEGSLREIYREIKEHPISPPMVSIYGFPLQIPALHKDSSEDDAVVGRELITAGDPLSIQAWTSYCQRVVEPMGDDVLSSTIVLFPEIWHVCTRIEMRAFTSCFRAHQAQTALQAEVASRLDASKRSSRAFSLESSALLAHDLDASLKDSEDLICSVAGTYVTNLSACAAAAHEFRLHSGVDLVISAMCKIALISLPDLETDLGTTARRGKDEDVDMDWALAEEDKSKLVMDTNLDEDSALRLFTEDLRAQLALSAAFTLCLPANHGHIICRSTWELLFLCTVRMIRCNVVSMHEKSYGSIGTPLTGLLDAYALASARAAHTRRSARAEAAARVAEATLPPTPKADISGSDEAEPREPIADGPDSITGLGIRTMLFGWLFGDGEETGPHAPERRKRTSVSIPTIPHGSEKEARELLEWLEEVEDPLFVEDARDDGPRMAHAYSDAESDGEEDAGAVSGADNILAAHTSDVVGSVAELTSVAFGRAVAALLHLAGVQTSLSWLDSETGEPVELQRPVKNSFDDGVSFVTLMDAAQYKCGIMHDEIAPNSQSPSSRIAVNLLRAVLPDAIARRTDVAPCHNTLAIVELVLQDICFQYSAATRRYRCAALLVLDVLCAAWKSENPDMHAVIPDLIHACWSLCVAPNATAPAFRMLFATILPTLIGDPRLGSRCDTLQNAQPRHAKGADGTDNLSLAFFDARFSKVHHILSRPLWEPEWQPSCLDLLLFVALDSVVAIWSDEYSPITPSSKSKAATEDSDDDTHALEVTYITTVRTMISALLAAAEQMTGSQNMPSYLRTVPLAVRCFCAMEELVYPTVSIAIEDVVCVAIRLLQLIATSAYVTCRVSWARALRTLERACQDDRPHVAAFAMEALSHAIISAVDALHHPENKVLYWQDVGSQLIEWYAVACADASVPGRGLRHAFAVGMNSVLTMIPLIYAADVELAGTCLPSLFEQLQQLSNRIQHGPQAEMEECEELINNFKNILSAEFSADGDAPRFAEFDALLSQYPSFRLRPLDGHAEQPAAPGGLSEGESSAEPMSENMVHTIPVQDDTTSV